MIVATINFPKHYLPDSNDMFIFNNFNNYDDLAFLLEKDFVDILLIGNAIDDNSTLTLIEAVKKKKKILVFENLLSEKKNLTK